MTFKLRPNRSLQTVIFGLFLLGLIPITSCGGGGQIGGMFISKFDTTAVCDKKVKLLRMRNDSSSEMIIEGAMIDRGTNKNGDFNLAALMIGEQVILSDAGAIEKIVFDDKGERLKDGPFPLPLIPPNSTYTWKIEFTPGVVNSIQEAMLDIAFAEPAGVVQVKLEGASGDLNVECAAASLGAGGSGGTGGSSGAGGTGGNGGSGGSGGSGGTTGNGGSGGGTGGVGGAAGDSGNGGSGGSAGSDGEVCTGGFEKYCGEVTISLDAIHLIPETDTSVLVSSTSGEPSYEAFPATVDMAQDSITLAPILEGFLLPPPNKNAGAITELVFHYTEIEVDEPTTGTFDRTTGDIELSNINIHLISDQDAKKPGFKSTSSIADNFNARMVLKSLTTKKAFPQAIGKGAFTSDRPFTIAKTLVNGKPVVLGKPVDPENGKLVLVGVSPGFYDKDMGHEIKKIGLGKLGGNLTADAEAVVQIEATIKTK